jgi:hypothetical protein
MNDSIQSSAITHEYPCTMRYVDTDKDGKRNYEIMYRDRVLADFSFYDNDFQGVTIMMELMNIAFQNGFTDGYNSKKL